MKTVAIALTFAGGLAAAGLAAATPACQAVDGNFSHVWGGLVQSSFVTDTNPLVAWTVEDGGRIRATRDGATWAFQTTPPCVQGQLRGVHFLAAAPRTGWAVGDGGVVVHTTTAGTAWDCLPAQLDPAGQPAELWAVRFRDPLNGWLAGKHLLRWTDDGGQSWHDVTVHHSGVAGFTLADVENYALAFLTSGSDYVALASAEPGLLLRTDATSGGKVWEVVYDVCLAPPLCSACAPANVCTDPLRLELWDVELVPGASVLANAEAVAAGGFGAQCGVHLASHDGGLSWSQEQPVDNPCNSSTCPGTGGQLVLPTQYGATTFADRTALSVGYAGTILRRDPTCSPAVWRPEPQIQGPNGAFTQPFAGVDGNGAGGGAGVAWITAMFNGIFKSIDGGQIWTPQTVANNIFRIGAIHFANATDGWSAGQGFRIQKTATGGSVWTDQSAPPAGSPLPAGTLRGIVFAPDALTGVAAGGFFDGSGNLKLLRTADGGANWLAPAAVPGLGVGDHNLNAVTWSGGSSFWAVGLSGTVLFSRDGGAHWGAVPIVLGGLPVTDATLNGVAFADPDTGFVAGARAGQGRIYRVTHATDPVNRTWVELSPPAGDGVVELKAVAVQGAVAYAVGRKATATGDTGVIYRWNGSAFVEETGVPALPACDANPAGQGLLNQVALATAAGGVTKVFVGGSCGRFLRYDGTLWQELKSQTSFHVNSMSFFAADGGFVHATAGSHGVIVRYSGN